MWDPTINLGEIVITTSIIGGMVGSHYTIKTRVDNLTKAIDKFSLRLDRHEDVIRGLSGDLQKTIGILEELRRT